MSKSIIITVKKPPPLDNGILDNIFGASQAISEAVSKFWKLGLAKSATLGKVEKILDGYNVEINYTSH